MNIEITDLDMILNHLETTSLEPHDDYSSEFTYKDQKILYKYIKQLQQENKILKENAENNDKVVDKVNWENMLLKKENKQLKDELKFTIGIVEHNRIISGKNKETHQLKDNWTKLRECLKDVMNSSEADDKEFVETILDKMQELEGSDSNVKD